MKLTLIFIIHNVLILIKNAKTSRNIYMREWN